MSVLKKNQLSEASKETKNERQIAHGLVEYWVRSFCRAETNKGIDDARAVLFLLDV